MAAPSGPPWSPVQTDEGRQLDREPFGQDGWLEDVRRQFFCMVAMRDFEWPAAGNSCMLSDENLSRLIKETVGSELCLKYPPSLSYRKHFLKSLMQKCEDGGVEPCEELYEVYASLVAQTDDDTTQPCYKTYISVDGTTVTLRESLSLISEGTTGLLSWPAALYLASWAVHNKHLIENRRVLELGSGVGLLGLVVCKGCRPASYTFSDCHPAVLQALVDNIKLNFSTSKTGSSHQEETDLETTNNGGRSKQNPTVLGSNCDNHILPTRREPASATSLDAALFQSEPAGDMSTGPQEAVCVNCVQLDWENMSGQQLERLKPDLILAADVVYDPEIVTHLVKALKSSLLGHSKGQRPLAFVASTIRNSDTYQDFLQKLDQNGVDRKSVGGEYKEQQPMFIHRTVNKVDLLKLSLQN